MTENFSPSKGLSFRHLKYDFPAGLVVFLIALPLCLGISLASGAPLIAGVITGIIGGLVVSVASGSQTSVSGPAAGLTVVVLDAIHRAGTYEGFLTAVVLAGILQLAFGFFRAGVVSNYFPSSVIKGMLAAIGAILILKQLPHLLGYDADYLGDFSLLQLNDENSFSAIVKAAKSIHPGSVIISMLALAIMIFWQRIPVSFLRLVPAPLAAVIAGIVINVLFLHSYPALHVSGEMLVTIPSIDITQATSFLSFPDFSVLARPDIYLTAITIALIASMETLLSVEAIDKLDPLHRHTDTNRELKAQGIGNIVAGLIGGIPMTAVIVRGSANVNAGAKSRTSSFIHGALLLLSVLFLYNILNLIPLAALAAILLVIGYKLTQVSLFKSIYKAGFDQFVPFIVTFFTILFTDLLIGIFVGLCVGFLFILKRNSKNSHAVQGNPVEDKPLRITLSDEMSFLNKAKLKETLYKLPGNTHVVIDGSKSYYIDHDVIELIHTFKKTGSRRNIKIDFIHTRNFEQENAKNS